MVYFRKAPSENYLQLSTLAFLISPLLCFTLTNLCICNFAQFCSLIAPHFLMIVSACRTRIFENHISCFVGLFVLHILLLFWKCTTGAHCSTVVTCPLAHVQHAKQSRRFCPIEIQCWADLADLAICCWIGPCARPLSL